MKLQIGENVKLLRTEKGITQEQLAHALGVTCQSVSRWELGICYPDMELLPSIANFFEITLDELLGMDQIRSQVRQAEIFTAVMAHERQENWPGAIAVLRDALKTYPNDDGLLTELALVLSKTENRKDLNEAILLSEKVLSRSTNEKLRSTARANLCFLYKAAGQPEKALALGKTLPHIWECREILLPDLVPESERTRQVERSMNIAGQVFRDIVSGRKIHFSLGYKEEAFVNSKTMIQYFKQI